MSALEVRLHQTHLELEAVSAEAALWLERLRKSSYVNTYDSHYRAIERLVGRAVDELKRLVPSATDGGVLSSTYRVCKDIERGIVGLRTVVDFLRHRLDQRGRNDEADALLRAADEVVWSCWLQVFPADTPAPPLVFLEPCDSPSTTPPHLVPPELRVAVNGPLREWLNALPLPLLRLPISVLRTPWLLTLLAHEVGHQVQYALGNECVVGFSQQVARLAGSQAWAAWGREIWADVFSIMMVGPAAIRTIYELELSDPVSMAAPRTHYPPAVVRLHFMEAVWTAWSGRPSSVQAEIAALAGAQWRGDDLATAARLAQALVEQEMYQGQTLLELFGVARRVPDRRAEQSRSSASLCETRLAEHLTALENHEAPRATIEAARTAAAAATAWFFERAPNPQQQREMGARMIDYVASCSAAGSRSSTQSVDAEGIALPSLEALTDDRTIPQL